MRNSRRRSLLRERRGNVAVECAMIMPLMAVLMFGAVELGRYFLAFNSISSATEQLSRYAMIQGDATATQLEAQLEQYLVGVDAADLTLAFSTEIDATTGLTFQVVDVSMVHQTSVPFVDIDDLPIRSRIRTPLPPV